jgi:hypothetical protein
MDGQMSFADLDSWCGKTFPEHSAVTEERTSRQSLQKSSGLSDRTLPMFLYLHGGGGDMQEALWDTERTDGLFPSVGDYMMRSFGESPSEERESHLSQILEDSAPPKYFLSARACRGILNRAERRGKALPDVLMEALVNQIEREE